MKDDTAFFNDFNIDLLGMTIKFEFKMKNDVKEILEPLYLWWHKSYHL